MNLPWKTYAPGFRDMLIDGLANEIMKLERQRDVLAAAIRRIGNTKLDDAPDALVQLPWIARDALREAGIDDNSAARTVVEGSGEGS